MCKYSSCVCNTFIYLISQLWFITNLKINYKMKNRIFIISALTTLCIFPKLSVAQAPNLGSAADFALFTTIGAVGNSSISHITGNVGTNNGSITGFGNVNGIMNNANGTSAQCATDLLAAYNQLNATVPTFFPAPLLGNGQTLNAGVYSIASNSTLNNTLTLDGQGNSNAVFIIKIQGSFSASAGAQVILTNSAKACNVFWKVEGLVSMAAGSTLRGSIIINNSAFVMYTGSTLEGRALSTSGSITVDGVLVGTPVGCGSPFLTGPASPTLNTVGCYALFSSNGPVTNAGISFVTGGDIGTNVGLTTGFNALNVSGAIHPIPDGSTSACASDLLTAFNYLNTLPYDIELLYPPQFGNKLVLTPHVYRLNGATTFNDTLFLNGMGNSNSVFVLQALGAITTSTYAKVILTNGTQAKNVFWSINGALNINSYADLIGTMICNNGAINMASGATLNGRALTTNGSMSTAAIILTVTPDCPSLTAPNINLQPINQTVCNGGSATYSVSATGSGLTYQWRKGTVNLINGGNISGTTTSSLTINPVTMADQSTNYNVIISGSIGPAETSNMVSLVINVSPSITTQPFDQTSCESSPVNFSTSAVGTSLTYVWRKGSVNLVNGSNISGANSAVLSINPVNSSDAASDYNVVISGSCLPVVNSTDAALIICDLTSIALLNNSFVSKSALVYPNPFSNSLELVLSSKKAFSNCEFKMFDVLGSEVVLKFISEKQTSIETSKLAPGIYYYQLSENNKIIQSGKLVSHQ